MPIVFKPKASDRKPNLHCNYEGHYLSLSQEYPQSPNLFSKFCSVVYMDPLYGWGVKVFLSLQILTKPTRCRVMFPNSVFSMHHGIMIHHL